MSWYKAVGQIYSYMQNHFLDDVVNSDQIDSLNLVSNFFSLLQSTLFRTYSIIPPLFPSLSLLALISQWASLNCEGRLHCVKSVPIRSYSGPHFPAFGLNTERYEVSLRIQSECGKRRTRITPNMGTFQAVLGSSFISLNIQTARFEQFP